MPRGFLCAVPDTVHELFLKRDTIPPKTPAIVMGVLDEMAFNKSSEISIFAVVLYRKKDCGTSFQLPLDSAFQFTVRDLIEGHLETFLKPTRWGDFSDPDDEARDFFTAIVSSTFYQLKVGASLRISVTDKLSEIGLKCIMAASNESPSFWAGYPPGCLRALVVICIPISSMEYRLDVYAKDTKQVLLLAHRLSPFRVQEWRPENKSGLPECARSLSDELRLLLSAVQHPNMEYSPKAWADFKKNLSALEMKTDLDFHSYKHSS